MDTTPGPENAYLLPGRVDTAIRGDTGWELGDDWIYLDPWGSSTYVQSDQDGVWVATRDQEDRLQLSLLRAPVDVGHKADWRAFEQRSVLMEGMVSWYNPTPWGAERALQWVDGRLIGCNASTGAQVAEFAASGDISRFDVGDLNGDGYLEVAASNYDIYNDWQEPEVWVWDGTASGTAGPEAAAVYFQNDELGADEFGWDVFIPGDLDGDGFGDLFVAAWNGTRLYRGPLTGSPGVDDWDSYLTDSHVWSRNVSGVGDVDGDGSDDLVFMANRGAGVVSAIPSGESLLSSHVEATFECNGYLERSVWGFWPVRGVEERPLALMGLASVERNLLDQIWTTDMVVDGGTHSCLHEGFLMKNNHFHVSDVAVGDLDGDAAADVILVGRNWDMGAVLGLTPDHLDGK